MKIRLGAHLAELDASNTFDASRVFPAETTMLALPSHPLELTHREALSSSAATATTDDDGEDGDGAWAVDERAATTVRLIEGDAMLQFNERESKRNTADSSAATALPPLQLVIVSNSAPDAVLHRPRMEREIEMASTCMSSANLTNPTILRHVRRQQRAERRQQQDQQEQEDAQNEHVFSSWQPKYRSLAKRWMSATAGVGDACAMSAATALQELPVASLREKARRAERELLARLEREEHARVQAVLKARKLLQKQRDRAKRLLRQKKFIAQKDKNNNGNNQNNTNTNQRNSSNNFQPVQEEAAAAAAVEYDVKHFDSNLRMISIDRVHHNSTKQSSGNHRDKHPGEFSVSMTTRVATRQLRMQDQRSDDDDDDDDNHAKRKAAAPAPELLHGWERLGATEALRTASVLARPLRGQAGARRPRQEEQGGIGDIDFDELHWEL